MFECCKYCNLYKNGGCEIKEEDVEKCMKEFNELIINVQNTNS